MRVELLATSAQFPRLPLASIDTDTDISASLRFTAVEEEYFSPPRHLRGHGGSRPEFASRTDFALAFGWRRGLPLRSTSYFPPRL
jgi:hypothetical protein